MDRQLEKDIFDFGAFLFEAWDTPFKDNAIEIFHVEYDISGCLTIQVDLLDHPDHQYQIAFSYVSAFRVLDEGGLLELWNKTTEFGGRPARTSFRVRGHLWTKESPLSFLQSAGWSYFICSHLNCVEIVTTESPTITSRSPN